MEQLSRKIKLGFGIGDLGGNLFFTLIGFYLMYYLTDIVQLPSIYAGWALLIGKIWDAITDPVTGYVSDITRTKWGRRRPYIFIGAILTFISMMLLFSSPEVSSTLVLFFLVTLFFCMLNLSYTLVNIPYAALVPELTADFDERTVLTGYRMIFAVIGTLVGAGLVLPLVNLIPASEQGWLFMGTVMGGVMMTTALITVFVVREPERPAGRKAENFLKTYVNAFTLKPFLLALIPWTFFITGVTIIQSSLLYFFKYIYNQEELFQIALMFLLIMSLIFIPIWVKISKKIGKKYCYMIGMGIMIIGIVSFVIFGQEGRTIFAFVLMTISGIGLSTHYVIPHSILPDVVEYDYVKFGIRREGVFSSLWTFLSKIGQAFALFLTGLLLDVFQYSPNIQPEEITLLGFRIISGVAPVIFLAAGIIILNFFPITRVFYDKMITTGNIPEQ
ncbi:MAG: MFS transporter [Spirochaetia bacterium]